jgi:hypothetical protein
MHAGAACSRIPHLALDLLHQPPGRRSRRPTCAASTSGCSAVSTSSTSPVRCHDRLLAGHPRVAEGGVAWDWGSPISLSVFTWHAGLVAVPFVERRAAEPCCFAVAGSAGARQGGNAAIVIGVVLIGLVSYVPTVQESAPALWSRASGGGDDHGWPITAALSVGCTCASAATCAARQCGHRGRRGPRCPAGLASSAGRWPACLW